MLPLEAQADCGTRSAKRYRTVNPPRCAATVSLLVAALEAMVKLRDHLTEPAGTVKLMSANEKASAR
jgi:hypothetical protein